MSVRSEVRVVFFVRVRENRYVRLARTTGFLGFHLLVGYVFGFWGSFEDLGWLGLVFFGGDLHLVSGSWFFCYDKKITRV